MSDSKFSFNDKRKVSAQPLEAGLKTNVSSSSDRLKGHLIRVSRRSDYLDSRGRLPRRCWQNCRDVPDNLLMADPWPIRCLATYCRAAVTMQRALMYGVGCARLTSSLQHADHSDLHTLSRFQNFRFCGRFRDLSCIRGQFRTITVEARTKSHLSMCVF